jgi:hypothetical protein
VGKIISFLKNIAIKGAAILSIVSLISSINMVVPSYGFAESSVNKESEEIIQPFELTKPAQSREEAYEEVAELTEHPKELIKAQNKEEKAEEKALKKQS